MRAKLKAQKICLWITLVAMLPIQVFGWIIAVVGVSDIGGYVATEGFVVGALLVIALLCLAASFVLVNRCGKYDVPPKGILIVLMLTSTISPIVSSSYAFYIGIGFLILLLMISGCMLGVVNLIFSLRTVNEAKRLRLQS